MSEAETFWHDDDTGTSVAVSGLSKAASRKLHSLCLQVEPLLIEVRQPIPADGATPEGRVLKWTFCTLRNDAGMNFEQLGDSPFGAIATAIKFIEVNNATAPTDVVRKLSVCRALFNEADERFSTPVSPGGASSTLADESAFIAAKTLPNSVDESTTIISLGKGCYRIGDSRPYRVTDSEDGVLSAFLKYPAMEEQELDERSGFSRSRDILRDLESKYDGKFAPAIHRPGGKGKGGYHVSIRVEKMPPA
jgi:hypothetical protein